MKISLTEFRHELTECLLNFLWRKWSQMGVFGRSSGHDELIVDPEALLPFTLEVARHDVRVFDEVVDWLHTNGRWINVQRLRNIIKFDGTGDRRVSGAVADLMTERDRSPKWRAMARSLKAEKPGKAEPLFMAKGKPMAYDHGDRDGHFERHGLIRQKVHTRGMSQPVNMRSSVNFVFKIRAMFGVTVRADVMAYLIMNREGHPRDVAHRLAYSPLAVQNVMVDLAQAGVAKVRPEGKTRKYWVETDQWRHLLMEDGVPDPAWIDWRALMRGLTTLWRAAWALREEHMTDFVFSSEMRQAMRAAQNDLYASGIGFEIEDDRAHLAESYGPVFLENMKRILGTARSEPTKGHETGRRES